MHRQDWQSRDASTRRLGRAYMAVVIAQEGPPFGDEEEERGAL